MTVPKFRAWHKPMQRMSEVLAISYERQKVKIRHLRGTTHMTVLFDDVELMQSTGLVDKNGQEIFEGDIVEFEDADDIENVYINQGVIEWCQGGFTVSNRTTVTLDDLLDEDTLEVTIVGNIYDNPELLDDWE